MVCVDYCEFKSQKYWDITVGDFSAIYSIDIIGGITPTCAVNRKDLTCLASYGESDFLYPCELTFNLRLLLDNYSRSIQAIAKNRGWELKGEGLSLFDAFTQKLKKERAETWTSLDLSNSGLELLPPQISLLISLKKLNLSKNDIYLFPPELQLLPLEEVDISGNTRLQSEVPEWVGKKQITLIAYDINMKYVPRGLSPGQIKCENDLKVL